MSLKDARLAATVLQQLRRAGRPLFASELAPRCGRRCTSRFRELLGSLWLAGLITQADAGFVARRRHRAKAA